MLSSQVKFKLYVYQTCRKNLLNNFSFRTLKEQCENIGYAKNQCEIGDFRSDRGCQSINFGGCGQREWVV